MKQSIIPILFSIIFIGMIPSQAHCNDYAISDEQAHLIVLNGTPEDVKQLIQSGYDVNNIYSCSSFLNTAVKSAAIGAQMSRHPSYALEKIKILVENGADVNLVPCPEMSMTALQWAISLPSEVKYLEYTVNDKIDNNIKNKKGYCDFPGIVSKPCSEINDNERENIRLAIEQTLKSTYTSLIPYFMEIVDYLVKQGADINSATGGTINASPLHFAAMNSDDITIEPLNYLIKKKANLNVQDTKGNTPLFWAYASGNYRAVDALIDAGADKNIKNKEGAFYNEVKSINKRLFLNEDMGMFSKNF